jgi:predicted alpha/beta superfamily hydrolase
MVQISLQKKRWQMQTFKPGWHNAISRHVSFGYICLISIIKMKHLLFLCFLMISIVDVMAQSPNNFSLGFADSVRSKLLKEQRQLLLYTPYQGKRSRAATKDQYPVIYVLDGENNFRSVAITVERLADMGMCPPMIVVGIPNTDRNRDLTPTTVANNTDGVKNSGGGERFISFIERELIPHIDSNYLTAPYKLLIGHSLAGLMVVQTMVHHKDLFNGYIAIEPSIWWDNHKVLNEVKSAIETNSYVHQTLFLAIANHMDRGVDTTAVQADTSDQTELTRYNLDLIHHVHKHPENKLRFKEVYYANDNHQTVPLIAVYDALRFIFDYYVFPRYAGYQITNPNLPSVITAHYRKIAEELGYQVLPDEPLVNNLGYYALRSKQYDMAGKLFALNVLNYPKDANPQDSYGDYYLAKGDRNNAISCFKKALAISEIPETRAKLNLLLKDK